LHVLVTGASGFLGGHLVKELLSREYQVRAFVRKTSDLSNFEKSVNFEFIHGDLADKQSIIEALSDVELIFHNGAFFEEWAPYKKFHLHNVQGTKNVLDAAQAKDIDRLVYTSTADMYKYSDEHVLTENAKKQARGNYQKSKIEAEKVIDSYISIYDFKVTKIRPPGILGPGNRYMPQRLVNGVSQEKIPVIGSGTQIQSYIDVRDAARSLVLVAESKKAIGETYNVISDNSSVLNYWSTAAEILEKEIEFLHYPYGIAFLFGALSEFFGKITFRKTTPKATRYRVNYFGKQYIIDDSKIRSQLKYEPKYDFRRSMNDMLKEHLK